MATISAFITAAQLLISNNSKKAMAVAFLLGVMFGMVAC